MNESLDDLRARLHQLDRLRNEGVLSDDEHGNARRELEQQVVASVVSGPTALKRRLTPALTLVVVAVAASLGTAAVMRSPATPAPRLAAVGAVGGALGDGNAWAGSLSAFMAAKPGAADSGPAPHATGFDDIRRMVESLRNRLDEQPDDPQGWAILARSYSVLGEHDKAVPAFERALTGSNDDASLLADYADALAVTQGRSLEGRPSDLVQRALVIDPVNTKALSLAASAAFSAGDYRSAVTYWENLVATAPEDHPLRAPAVEALEEARAKVAVPTDATPMSSRQPG
ncbi:MAG: hypothetical protein R3E87_09430 [Burkholderiaceae bacterium]